MNNTASPSPAPEGMQALDSEDDPEFERHVERIFEALQAGATFKDLYDIGPDTLEAIYGHAYGYYQQGRLDDAESLFRLLVTYDFYNVDYAMGLGAVFQRQKKYDKALDVYAAAYTLSGGNRHAMLYAGQCNLLLHRRGKARRCFQIVIDENVNDRLHQQAQTYLDAFQRAPASPGTNHPEDVNHANRSPT